MRALIMLLFAVVLGVGLLQPGPARAQSFSSTIWQLTKIDDKADFVPSSRYAIRFLTDGTVSVDADCNRASGTWRADGGSSGTIQITITLTAVAGCPSPSLESEFLDKLEAATNFTLSSNELKLSTATGTELLTFRPLVA